MAEETAGPLAPLRAEIDICDAEIVALLARRMEIVERVIAIKSGHGIPALLPDRVEDVVARVRGEAGRDGVPPDLVETVWRAMMDWIIAYEDERLGAGKGEGR
ncbi:chorismate mutase [Enterovirga sp.]|uniref:chorismate mutase n=1 Tax=Enterovirga sp. TaxID=2026350 RepID=UPI002BCA3665|nr:chorismate mutase [Enterovirga sp.]HMO30560.1 chorismate mutase [Enterovirga sp.]